MSKRKKFVLTSFILTAGFLILLFLNYKFRFVGISVLTFFTFLLFVWSLREGLRINTTLFTLVLPIMFTLSVGLFWFLLPANFYAQFPILIFYGLGIYTLCLVSNIFTVAAIRTIALTRAAKGVGFVLTLVVSFLLFDTALSLKLPIWISTIMVLLISFVLIIQSLWSVILDGSNNKLLFTYSFYFSLIISQVFVLMFFWPVTVVVGSLFLTVLIYVLLGLGQAKIEGRLFPQTMREYLLVGILVFFGMFIATRWGS